MTYPVLAAARCRSARAPPPSAPAKPRMVLARADHLGRAYAFKVCASALCAPCAMENRTLAVEAPARPLDEPRASLVELRQAGPEARTEPSLSLSPDLVGKGGRKKEAALSLTGSARRRWERRRRSRRRERLLGRGEGGNELGFPSPRLFRGYIPRRRAAVRSQPSDLNERLRSRRGARGRGVVAGLNLGRPAVVCAWALSPFSSGLLSRLVEPSRVLSRAAESSRVAGPCANGPPSGLRALRPLNGANFLDWKGKVMTCLAWNDLDIVFRQDRPAAPAEGQTSPALEKWERSNRMATMVMSQTISPGIKGAIPLKNAQGVEYTATELLAKIEENFKSSSKTYASTLIMKLVSSQYNGKTGIREHILSMCDMANKLKEMQMEISDGFLVHFILTSLPSPQYAAFKINYNTTKAIWTLSDLISYCVEEEERLKTEKMKDVVNMVGNLSLSDTPKNQHESGSSKQGAKKNFKKNKNKNFAPRHENKFKKGSHTSGGKMLRNTWHKLLLFQYQLILFFRLQLLLLLRHLQLIIRQKKFCNKNLLQFLNQL
nr:unnamed protein product [Digitaria exilis]